METTDTLKPSTSAPKARPQTSRRRRSVLKPLGVVAAAAVVIVLSDAHLRREQDLVKRIVRDDVPVMMPTRDLLRERVQARNEWQRLVDAVEKARLTLGQSATQPASAPSESKDPKAKAPLSPQEKFIRASTELAEFLGKQLGMGDMLRQRVLLDAMQTLPEEPATLGIYFDLLLPAWSEQLSTQHPRFVDRIEQMIAGKGSSERLPLTMQLAEALRQASSVALEQHVLLRIHKQFGLRFRTYVSMQRLAEILPPSHPDHARLKREIEQYGNRRDLLLRQAQAYTQFETLRGKNDLKGMLAWIEQQPQVTDPFNASAAAIVADTLARQGKLTQARGIRGRLLNYDLQDMDEATAVMEVALPEKGPGQRRSVSLPDTFTVTFQKWRALLDAGQIDAARAVWVMDQAFENPKWLQDFSESETLIAQGLAAQLKPAMVLGARDSEGGPTGTGAAATIELQPQGAAVDASIRCKIEARIDQSNLVFTILADEPRKPMPACKVTKRDEEVTRDESIELIFLPDRSPDLVYRLAINTDRVMFDARLTGSLAGGNLRVDRALDLSASVESVSHQSGWGLRVTVPRELVFPSEQNLIRFNARRFRNVAVGKSSVQQIYSWAPGREAQVRPEQSGWLIHPERP